MKNRATFQIAVMIIKNYLLQATTLPSYTALALVLAIIAIILVWYFGLRGIFLVKDNEIGILTKKMLGAKMPEGQIIARNGQIGIQANMLMPGLYWRFPLVWKHEMFPITEINPDQVGLIESVDGNSLPKGRLLGDEVDCNSFQDASMFYKNGGFKGPQVAILRPGRYRINTKAFRVTVTAATKIDKERVAVVTAEDGNPLPSDYIIAPEPVETPNDAYQKARPHKFFQDGQAFLESGGYRGPQLLTLQPGQYYVNTLLFKIDISEVAEVPPGFVAVLRSNVGVEIDRSSIALGPRPSVPSDTGFDQTIHSDVETLLTNQRNTRGIWLQPVAPGKYNLNRSAYTAYLVPTSAVTIDWAASTDIRADHQVNAQPVSKSPMSRPDTLPKKDTSDFPYLDLTDEEKAAAFFRFSQLRVTSMDGFQLEVDVRMVIRIMPENAAFVIARFGSVENLIEQIVHPLIDSSFRNKAGEKKAIEFIQSRTSLQQEALEKAKEEFEKYHVEAQNLLIAYIDVDQSLLATQTNREIALQQQLQYQEQAKAEEQRIAVQEKTAIANKQPDVVAAKLQIDINANSAQALVKQAEGIRDSTKTKADGEAEAIRKVGQAQADAYSAQVSAIGADRVAFIKYLQEVKEGNIKITPDIVVGGGDGGNQAFNLFSAIMAKNLALETKKKKTDEDESDQNQQTAQQGSPDWKSRT